MGYHNDRRRCVCIDAILDKERDAALYAEAIAEADPPLISTATLLEVNIVMLNRHGVKAARMVDRLIKEAGFQVEVSLTARPLTLHRWQIGTVVMIYPDGACEVEFADRDGRAHAILPIQPDRLMVLYDAAA